MLGQFCARFALISTVILYVNSTSLTRELDAANANLYERTIAGNSQDVANEDVENHINGAVIVKKRVYDGQPKEQANSESLEKRMHRLRGDVKFGGKHKLWRNSLWKWRNAIKKLKKDKKDNTKLDDDNSRKVKRMHHLYGKVKFGGQKNRWNKLAWKWKNPFRRPKRVRDEETQSNEVRSNIEKRVDRLSENAMLDDANNKPIDGIGLQPNVFKREKLGSEELANTNKRMPNFIQRKLRFGSRSNAYGGWRGTPSNLDSLLKYLKQRKSRPSNSFSS